MGVPQMGLMLGLVERLSAAFMEGFQPLKALWSSTSKVSPELLSSQQFPFEVACSARVVLLETPKSVLMDLFPVYSTLAWDLT